MKFRDILSTASSNMLRSKLRTILTIIAIFVGTFTITMTLGISSGISRYIDKQLGNIGADDALIVRAKVKNPLESDSGLTKYDPNVKKAASSTSMLEMMLLKPEDITKIEQQDGIKSVKPIISATPSYIEGANGQKFEINVTAGVEGTNIDLAAGSALKNSKNEVLLPIKYIKTLGYNSADEAVGKTVVFGINKGAQPGLVTISAVIAGVEQESIFGSNGVMTSQALMDELHNTQISGLTNVKTQYFAAVARFDKTISEKELTKIKDGLADKGYTATTIKDEIGIVKQIINAITYVLVFFGAISLLAASFGIINTLFMAVQERTKEIGLMKAIGMSKGRIFILFSIEAILIGFWGSLLGVLAAMGIGNIANSIASNSFLKDLPGFDLTVFPPLDVTLIILLIAFIAFLAGTLPARRAANLDPIQALRYE